MIHCKKEPFTKEEIRAVQTWLAHSGRPLFVLAVKAKIAVLEAEHLQRWRDSQGGRIRSEVTDADNSLMSATPYYHFLNVLKELTEQTEPLSRATLTEEEPST